MNLLQESSNNQYSACHECVCAHWRKMTALDTPKDNIVVEHIRVDVRITRNLPPLVHTHTRTQTQSKSPYCNQSKCTNTREFSIMQTLQY